MADNDDGSSKPYFYSEQDYMRMSETRIGLCSFDFSLIYPQCDTGTIRSEEEQDMNYIAECFNKAAQQEDEPQIETTEYQDSSPTQRPTYSPVDDGAPLRLPQRGPAHPRDADIITSRGQSGPSPKKYSHDDSYTGLGMDKSEVV